MVIDSGFWMLLEAFLAMGVIALTTWSIRNLVDVHSGKQRYIEEIKRLKEELKLSRDLLDSTRSECEEKLRNLSRLSEPARAIIEAYEAGAIQLVDPTDNGKVVPMIDGTLVCEKRHIVWPRQVGSDGDSGYGVDGG